MEIVEKHKENCTLCGQCLEVCPRYEGIDISDITGRLYEYLEGKSGIDPETLSRCLTCGLCGEACPEGLGLKMLISPARKKLVDENGLGDRQTMVDPDAGNNIFKKISELSEISEYGNGIGPVVYFPGCAATYINTSMSKAAVAILKQSGVDYTVLNGLEYCCGAVSAGAGNLGPIQRHGQKNIEEIKKRGAKILVTACPGCFKAFKDIYPKLFGTLDFEVLHISQYLERLLLEGKLVPKTQLNHRVFYHDPCHLTRVMGVYREARAALKSIPGTELANETPENSACCGFGGGVRVGYPSESLEIAADRYRAAKEMGCDVIITNCGGCMQNLVETRIAGKTEEKIEVYDLAEYMALAIGEKIPRDDEKMLELVNLAYSQCITGYGETEATRKKEPTKTERQ